MKVNTAFKFSFDVEGYKADFTVEAENVDAAKAILAGYLTKMVEELKK